MNTNILSGNGKVVIDMPITVTERMVNMALLDDNSKRILDVVERLRICIFERQKTLEKQQEFQQQVNAARNKYSALNDLEQALKGELQKLIYVDDCFIEMKKLLRETDKDDIPF